MPTPFITVLVDTYNHEAFIDDAIASVLGQDFSSSDMEILVIDDGSTDATPEMLRKFGPRVKVLRKTNGGQASAFNAGIPEARGEIVAFLDGDDWWERGKLTRIVEAFATDSSLGTIGHGITEVLPDGNRRVSCLKEETRFQCSSPEGARILRTRKSFLGTSRLAIRRKLLSRVLPVPASLVVEADEYLFTVAAVLSPALILTNVMTFYRHHNSNLFQIADANPARIRQKLAVLVELSRTLSTVFLALSLDQKTALTILEAIETEADQIRLGLDSRPPWETVRTELRLLRIHHADASFLQRAWTFVRLLPALGLPSRKYYRYRQQLVGSTLYRSLRKKALPFPIPTHSRRSGAP